MSVLFSKNRDTFHDFEYRYINGYNALMKDLGSYAVNEGEEWYEGIEIQKCLEINQITMHAGCLGIIREFWIKDIKNINNGYKITVVNSRFGKPDGIDEGYYWNSILFPIDKPSFSLLLILDNDYLDMYLDTMENHLATFVKINRTIIDELNNLLKNNTCDLSKITSLPRRADGSTDYRLPVSEPDAVIAKETKNAADSNDDKNESSSLPLWAWIAIIGIAVAVSGGVAVFVVLRKKAI